jgi:hypothetical protein
VTRAVEDVQGPRDRVVVERPEPLDRGGAASSHSQSMVAER